MSPESIHMNAFMNAPLFNMLNYYFINALNGKRLSRYLRKFSKRNV